MDRQKFLPTGNDPVAKEGDGMKRPKDGGAAFPCDDLHLGSGTEGLTKRDWFAGMALSNQYLLKQWEEIVNSGHDTKGIGFVDCVCKSAYNFADAMLKAREADNENL